MAGSVADKEFSRKLLHWITLLEQLHVRASWLLQVLEDDEQSDKYFWSKENRNLSLNEIYKKYVENRVFSTPAATALTERYNKLLILDHLPELFDNFLKFTDLMISDLGGFSARSKHDLLSYTTNLNPALRSALAVIASYRENADTINRQMRVTYTVRSAKAFSRMMPQDFSMEELIQWLVKHGFAQKDTVLGDAVLQKIIQFKANGRIMQRIIGDGESPSRYDAIAGLGITDPFGQEVLIDRWIAESKLTVSAPDPDLAAEQKRPADFAVGSILDSLTGGLLSDWLQHSGLTGSLGRSRQSAIG